VPLNSTSTVGWSDRSTIRLSCRPVLVVRAHRGIERKIPSAARSIPRRAVSRYVLPYVFR
jgi:hypothetical protein